MKNFKVLSLTTLAVLTACAHQLTPQEQAAQQELLARANRPVTCIAGKDCERKWSRAVQWVTQNSSFKIQTQSDNLIQTFNPVDGNTASGFMITKFADEGDSYKIAFSSACDNWIQCFPTALELQASFVDFVMGPPKATDPE